MESAMSRPTYKRLRTNSLVRTITPTFVRNVAGRKIRGKRTARKSVMSVHRFTRTAIGSNSTPGTGLISMNTFAALGLNGTGAYDMEWSFTLVGAQCYIAGTANNLVAMANVADFTNLFDKYRIDCVEVCMTFSANSHGTTSGLTSGLPIVYYAEDYDDIGAINLNAISQYDNLRKWQVSPNDQMKTFKIYPKPQEVVYRTLLANGYQQGSNKKWQDTLYTDTPYFGLKMVVDPIVYAGGSTPIGSFQFSFKYFISCKDTK